MGIKWELSILYLQKKNCGHVFINLLLVPERKPTFIIGLESLSTTQRKTHTHTTRLQIRKAEWLKWSLLLDEMNVGNPKKSTERFYSCDSRKGLKDTVWALTDTWHFCMLSLSSQALTLIIQPCNFSKDNETLRGCKSKQSFVRHMCWKLLITDGENQRIN